LCRRHCKSQFEKRYILNGDHVYKNARMGNRRLKVVKISSEEKSETGSNLTWVLRAKQKPRDEENAVSICPPKSPSICKKSSCALTGRKPKGGKSTFNRIAPISRRRRAVIKPPYHKVIRQRSRGSVGHRSLISGIAQESGPGGETGEEGRTAMAQDRLPCGAWGDTTRRAGYRQQ